jgi:hypothetical protein
MSPKTAQAIASYRADRGGARRTSATREHRAAAQDPGVVVAAEIAPPPMGGNTAREEDPADYLDNAGSSSNGDESASPWSRMLAEDCEEDHQWESDLLQACETSRESLLTIADQLLAGHPVWNAARAVDRALIRLADEYV